jgi:myosin heavy subunit
MEERSGLKDEVREHFELKKLRERVIRLEFENNTLKQENFRITSQLKGREEAQTEVMTTLHKNLDDNYNRIEEQEKKIEELQEKLKAMEQSHKDEMAKMEKLWKSSKAELVEKNHALELQLQNERDFKRAELEAQLADLRQQLVDQREAHRAEESAFERKKAADFEALKNHMSEMVDRTREKLKDKTRDQLKMTTKRTIMENHQKATELNYQNKETLRIIDENHKLNEENTQLRRKITIHKDLENELALRTHKYQKLIKKMEAMKRADITSMEDSADVDSFLARKAAPAAEADAPPSASHRERSEERAARTAQLFEENAGLRRQIEGVQANLQMVRHEFAQYRRDHATLTQLQDQSTRLIISALYELKNQRECDPFPPATYDEDADWQFVKMDARQKEYFFRILLERLNSSMCACCFPLGAQQQTSTSSLPQIGKANDHTQQGAHFSQFLWSVASGGKQASATGGAREAIDKGVQTETGSADPCLREGIWNPASRSRFNESPATPSMVNSDLRPWGARSASQKPRGAPHFAPGAPLTAR